MQIRELAVPDAWEITPVPWKDDRGLFLESFRHDRLAEATGRSFELQQANVSVSRRGVVRGIHFADTPPGQAKYVSVARGAGIDFIVDIRVGSPTFGTWDAVELDDESRKGLYLAEGLGHAFCALSDTVVVGYLCSEPYAPMREHGIHPLDPELDLPWPDGDLVLSPKDSAAPTLAEAAASGLLPDYQACRDFVTEAQRRAQG